jgi:pre-mRNA-processing factor 19
MNTADHHLRSDTIHQSLFVQQDEHYNNEQPTRRRRTSPSRSEQPSRFAGDGLDFRRPIMSQSHSQYIDLTREDSSRSTDSRTDGPRQSRSNLALPTARAQRLPRYERNIISIGSDAEEEQDGMTGAILHPHSFPRREDSDAHGALRYSMPRRPPQRGIVVEGRPAQDHLQHTGSSHRSSLHNAGYTTPQPSHVDNTVIDLTNDNDNDNDDDVVVTDTRYVGGGGGDHLGHPDPGMRDMPDYAVARIMPRLYERLRDLQTVQGRSRRTMPPLPLADFVRRHGPPIPPAPQPPPVADRVVEGYRMMRNMFTYDAPAFDMGLPGGNRAPSPKYEPPKDAAPGFTRTPGEDEVVVCPNCGDELATGSDEMKQELWVIKVCGHVSCLEFHPTTQLICSRC